MTVIDLFNTLQSVYLRNGKERYDQDKKHFKGGRLTEKYKRKYITSYLLGCSIGLSRLNIKLIGYETDIYNQRAFKGSPCKPERNAGLGQLNFIQWDVI
jgi:hypothetical protein